LARRERLRHLETLRAAAFGGAQALDPEEGDGVNHLLAAGGAALDSAQGVDPRLDELVTRWNALSYEAGDVAAELRGYAEGLDAEPGELHAVQARLTLVGRVPRQHVR